LDELDFDRLARLSLAGGNIANIALNSAFMAAELGAAVSMPLVLDAARAEYHKLERPTNDADFHWGGHLQLGRPKAEPVPAAEVVA
jgi:hypothetical protein